MFHQLRQRRKRLERIFNETHKVWVDSETQLYYETVDSENPIGQVVRGKTIPIKFREAEYKKKW